MGSDSFGLIIVYVRKGFDGAALWMIIYVDDILLMSTCLKTISAVKQELMSLFKMTDIGQVNVFLGVEFKRVSDGLELSQRKYTRDILAKFNMLQCKPVSTPMTPLQDFSDTTKLPTTIPYKESIGALLYLSTRTHPDISYAVGMLSRRSANPSVSDWKALKRVMRYIAGTENLALKFKHQSNEEFKLAAFSDADWAGDAKDRKSTSGMVITVNGSIVAWASKKQTSIALSSTESEYIALSQCGKEVKWFRQILEELGMKVNGPTVLFEDNSGAISWASGSKRTEHVDIKFHYIRDLVENAVVTMKYCPTERMIADVMTKAFSATRFEHLVNLMGMKRDALSRWQGREC